MQNQQRIVWPASPVVARAYLDQLRRTAGIDPDRDAAVTALLDRVDGDDAASIAADLEALATELEGDAEEAVWLDVRRFRSLAETLRQIASTRR